MSVSLFQAYIDFCRENSIEPSVQGLKVWKLTYGSCCR